MSASCRRGSSVSIRWTAAATVALLMWGCGGDPAPRERGIRHVVLVSLDALSALHSGAYGYERDTTPTLDRVAREGVLFENAYTQQAWTLSSHITMLTGLYPKVHRASEHRPSSPDATSLTEILQAEGFRTAAFTGVGRYMHPRFGLGRGFDFYYTGRSDRLDNKHRLVWLERQAARLEREPDHRFFLFAHYYAIHSTTQMPVPYYSPPEVRKLFSPPGPRWRHGGDTKLLLKLIGRTTPRDLEQINAMYDAAIRYTDLWGLGRLIDKLKELGLYEDTLIVLTADHGEEIFEHGRPLHDQPYEETARVPLVMRGAGVPRALRVPDIVELVDVMPTILSLLSLPIPESVQGQDLTPLFESRPVAKNTAHVDGIFQGLSAQRVNYPSSLTQEDDGQRWSYVGRVTQRRKQGAVVFDTTGRGELYLLDEDPSQSMNLIDRHPERARVLRDRLLDWYRRNEVLGREMRKAGDAIELTPEEREGLEALGYVQP